MEWFHTLRERRRLRARGLFRYHDGTRFRHADPAELWRKLLNHAEMDFAEMVPLAEQGRQPETGIVLAALSEIFQITPWDEGSRSGLTTWEILDLVRQFDEYLAALKKSTSRSRMPWQLSAYGLPTGTAPTPADPPAGPMNSSLDSSSTPSASRTEEATPSSEPSPTPSAT